MNLGCQIGSHTFRTTIGASLRMPKTILSAILNLSFALFWNLSRIFSACRVLLLISIYLIHNPPVIQFNNAMRLERNVFIVGNNHQRLVQLLIQI